MHKRMLLPVTVLVLSATALAGPPLICHPFITGDEPSLPWGSDKTTWNSPDPKYDTTKLVPDTLRLLDSSQAVLPRMETLRRAAIYAGKNNALALELSSRLLARALAAELKGQSNGLALFDAGYFIESMKQLSHITKNASFASLDGYDLARRSLPGIADKPSAEYALGLIQSATAWPNDHIRRAAAAAQPGTPLAQNLLGHYQNQSLADVKRTLALNSPSR